MIGFIRLAEVGIHDDPAVTRVGFPCRRPELLQPLVMTAGNDAKSSRSWPLPSGFETSNRRFGYPSL